MSIINFAEECGFNLYPRQQTLLKMVFLEKENFTYYDKKVMAEWASKGYIPTDYEERININIANGKSNFREVFEVSDRRSSKTFLGAIITAYKIYLNKDCKDESFVYVTSPSMTQSKKNQYADITTALLKSSDVFTDKVLEDGCVVNNKIKVKVVPYDRGGISKKSIVIIFDEFANMKDSAKCCEAYTPCLSEDALLYIPTPKNEQSTELEKLIDLVNEVGDNCLAKYPEMIYFMHPNYELYVDWNLNDKIKCPIIEKVGE